MLDNSCSMVQEHTADNGLRRPAADPDRRAVLGAQIVEGLTAGTDDDLSVLAFPVRAKTGVLELDGADAIRDTAPATGTWFRGPLTRARELLDGSDRRDRMLMVLSDGAPSDLEDPAEGRALLGLDDPSSGFDTLVLGLFPEADPEAERFLTAMARSPGDYQRVVDGSEVVTHFTEGFARALGSRAITGTLQPGGTTRFEVGRYVTEVMAVTSTTERSGAYTATLARGGKPVPSRRTGDNGCSRRPGYCDGPRMHFEVWRAGNDPGRSSDWSLSVASAGGTIAYGMILRYDLVAELEPLPVAKVDTPTPIRARLTWNGETFDDDAFFTRDDFSASVLVGGERVPLAPAGGGVFEGSFTPRSSRSLPLLVQFTNTWMSKSARGRLEVVKPPELTLEAPGIDFGQWRGGRWATSACRPLTFSSNHRYDPAATSFAFEGLPDGASVQIDRDGDAWTACLRAKGCCSDLVSAGEAALVATAVDAEGSQATARVPLTFHVDRTGFLRCWWPWLLALLLLLILVWFILGWVRPHDFDEDLTIRIAGSERQLSRSAALVLREQPRGRRGFYRNARVSLTHTGDFVARPRNAAVWIEAVGAGETRIHLNGLLEVKDRRTRKWVPVDEETAADGIRTNIVYRLGDIHFRFQ